jgi:hypothetical protein
MENLTLLQFQGADLNRDASVTAYMESLERQGFPRTHEQLLRELQAWVNPDHISPSLDTIQRMLDIENDILMDAGVTGVAAEHIPFLYSVIGRVCEDGGQAFWQHLFHAVYEAEQAHEHAVHQHMRETGCDRSEAVQFMSATALQRLQERHERVLYAVERSLDEAVDTVTSV